MISGLDIVCISSIEWNFVWQGHQEIASRLAQAGNRVLYIENTGVRSPGIRDAKRVSARFGSWARSMRSAGVREVAANMYLCSPLVLPPLGASWQRQINRRLLLPMVGRTAKALGMRDMLIWTYLPTDTALDLIQLLRTPRSLLVYYCIADFSQLAPHTLRLRQSEELLIRSSDLIFAQGPEIAAHCARWSDQVHIFPFGVDLDKFPIQDKDPGNASTVDDPSADGSSDSVQFLHSLPRPIIGYIGGVHRHVDFGLLIEMARARTDWSWVFVGPVQTSVAGLEELPNVYLLGQQEHHTLVRYIRQFDVCIVPYVKSHFTSTVVPTKINEYLAVGKPVVSTGLPAVVRFNAQHDILQTASTEPEDFLLAIERALRMPTDETAIARRRAVAELGNWDSRLEAMSQLIEIKLRDQGPGRKLSVKDPIEIKS